MKLSSSSMAGIGAARTVAIDVDSVLADVILVWTKEYNKRRHARITKREIIVWDIPKILPVSQNEIYQLFSYKRPTVAYVAKWLDFHDVYSDDLLFIYDSTPKAEYPFDILIDDAPKNLIDVTPPKSAILFNQPWNRDFDWPVRVNSLSDAEKML
ncbi:MAG: hypothetical protein K0S91_547 [Nitrososphaeraceae archaeon]|nr:hypothetical protein [Nitrososphaeraceae archaeon]